MHSSQPGQSRCDMCDPSPIPGKKLECTKRTYVFISHSVSKHMEYFTSKQRCWCVHRIGLQVSAFQQQYSDSEDSFTLALQLCNQTTGVSGAGRPSPISLFSHNRGSSSQPPNVSSSSVAALTVPPWQQPQTRFTDGPLKRQCSWSGGVWGRVLFPVIVRAPDVRGRVKLTDSQFCEMTQGSGT